LSRPRGGGKDGVWTIDPFRHGEHIRLSTAEPMWTSIISSLMTDQMERTSIIRFISWMEAIAAIGWFVNDLVEMPSLSSVSRDFACASLARFVRHDGPVSMLGAFEIGDWAAPFSIPRAFQATESGQNQPGVSIPALRFTA